MKENIRKIIQYTLREYKEGIKDEDDTIEIILTNIKWFIEQKLKDL